MLIPVEALYVRRVRLMADVSAAAMSDTVHKEELAEFHVMHLFFFYTRYVRKRGNPTTRMDGSIH
jgi:hypothetical protein